MIWKQLDKALIFLKVKAREKDQVLRALSQSFVDQHYCKESYVEAILAREVIYPTGIKLKKMGVAIPHTDAKHVIKNGLGLAILKEPIEFYQMGGNQESLAVSLVMMLAIKDKDQLDFLEKIMELFQDEAILEKIMQVKKEDELIEIIKNWENN